FRCCSSSCWLRRSSRSSVRRRRRASRPAIVGCEPRRTGASMSTTYRAISWNPQKRAYDLVAGGMAVTFLALFVAVQAALRPELTIETLLIRALGATAFTLLHVILCIGPLARLDRRFLPLLYNRRHLGVMMFTLALAHGAFSIIQFHAAGTLNPLVSVFVSNARYTTLSQIPFQPFGLVALTILFLMAA